MDQTRKELEEIFDAIDDPVKWEAFKRAKNEIFTKQINKEKAEIFSDYITDVFIETCKDKTIFSRLYNWGTKTDEEKLQVIYDITNLFMQKIKQDILDDRVTLYTNSGEVFQRSNDITDQYFKENAVSAIGEIKIKPEPSNKSALMTTMPNGVIYVNMDYVFFRDANTAAFVLMTLRHELAHVIDLIVPAISILDPETRMLAIHYYVSRDANLYTNNPLELNANTKRKEYCLRIKEMLFPQEQTHSNNHPQDNTR